MKKLNNLILCSLLSLTAMIGQDTLIINNDTMIVYDSDVDVDVNIKAPFGVDIRFDSEDEEGSANIDLRFGMVDLGVSTFADPDNGFDLPRSLDFMEQRLIKSTHVNVSLVRHRIGIGKKEKLGLEYGITFSAHKYYFEQSFRMEADKDNFFDAVIPTEENFRKNRLMANYITVPLGFNYRSNPDDLGNSFNIGIGGYAGFLMSSNHKIKGGDISGKVKIKDDFNLSKFMYGIEGRIGFGPVNLYAQYHLNEMFKDDRGPVLNQVNIGISILPY